MTIDWKSLPSWLRGGIIGVGISVIISLLFILTAPPRGEGFYIPPAAIYVLIMTLPYQFILNLKAVNNFLTIMPIQVLIFLLPIPTCFLIGALIGWITGIIKRPKNNK